MAQKTILDLLIQELRDAYSSESQIEQGLAKMAAAAASPNLKQAFTTHQEETRAQIERLDQVFEHLRASPEGNDCEATQGLVAEAKEVIDSGLPKELLDVALVMAAQKVEHYEIASYASLLALAEGCGLTEVAALLEQTLDEEEATDAKLTELAESEINERAFETARKAA